MHPLTDLLLAEGRERATGSSASDEAEAVLKLVYSRLSPVIGPAGLQALMRRASRSLEDQHGPMGRLADAKGEAEAMAGLHQVIGNGGADSGAFVRDLVNEMLQTLDRMIGSDLTHRLVAQSKALAGE